MKNTIFNCGKRDGVERTKPGWSRIISLCIQNITRKRDYL